LDLFNQGTLSELNRRTHNSIVNFSAQKQAQRKGGNGINLKNFNNGGQFLNSNEGVNLVSSEMASVVQKKNNANDELKYLYN